MKRKIAILGVASALLLCAAGCGNGDGTTSSAKDPVKEGQALVLSDQSVTLEGTEITSTSEGAVTVSNDIVYYEAGKGAEYGEGTQTDEHSADEAAAHKVVTIRQAGTYRVSGTLSAGQLAVDLGEDAKRDPEAVVTLILDGVDITCTVAPAVIFYNVYECDTAWVAYDEEEVTEYIDSPQQDTSVAGANVILADGSENNISGSYVSRIYKEGTTKKLHKYDGAFYSKMSMNIEGGSDGSGVLNITAANEGLDSEMHLTINGGNINIQAQNDGINTNEDYVSVTTINGGTIQINAGLGDEGDGIDSNGHLVINGGNVYTMANERTPDGGIDADGEILINGGYVIAMGTRNDAVAAASTGEYMELTFASTLPAGTLIELSNPESASLLSFTTEKSCQSITFASPDLEMNVAYTLKVNGVTQQYTGNTSGGFGGMGNMGGGMPVMAEDLLPPDGFDTWLESAEDIPDDIRTWLERVAELIAAIKNGELGGRGPAQGGQDMPQMPEMPEMQNGQQPPEAFAGQQGGNRPNDDGGRGGMGNGAGAGSTQFMITGQIHAFSGISDSAQASGKTQVTFSAEVSVDENGVTSVANIQSSVEVDSSHVQITVADIPSEDYAASCLLSDGEDVLAGILPEDPGTYRLTIAVTGDDQYTGASQFEFTIPEA